MSHPLNIIKSYRVLYRAEAPANTDHRVLIATIEIPFRPVYRNRVKPVFDVQNLRDDPGKALDYSVAAQNGFAALNDLSEDVEATWSSICNVIHTIAKNTVGYRRPWRKPWLSDETMDVIAAKARARLERNDTEHKRLQGVFRTIAKRDHEVYYQSLANEAEEGLQ